MTRYVDINDLQIYANELISGFIYNDFESWYGLDSVTTGSEARPQQNGQFANQQSTLPKTNMTLSGFYEGSSYADAAAAKRRLNKLYNNGEPVIVKFYDDYFPTWREVFMVKITPAHSAGRSYFTWTIDMETTESPYRYGIDPDVQTTTQSTAGYGVVDPLASPLTQGVAGNDGRLRINNTGDLPASSTFTVSGGGLSGGFSIVRVLTGEAITLAYPINDGSVVTVHTDTGRITIDGDDNDISGSATQTDWWTIPGETSEDIQFIGLGVTTGTPILTAITYPTL